MDFLRHGKAGVRLALFAMMTHLVISFGHIDLPGHHGEGVVAQHAQSLLALHDYHPDDHEKKHSHFDDDCATCWLVSAAGGFVLPMVSVVGLLICAPLIHSPVKTIDASVAGFFWICKARGPPLTYQN